MSKQARAIIYVVVGALGTIFFLGPLVGLAVITAMVVIFTCVTLLKSAQSRHDASGRDSKEE